jgi:hypothetical protein
MGPCLVLQDVIMMTSYIWSRDTSLHHPVGGAMGCAIAVEPWFFHYYMYIYRKFPHLVLDPR